MKTIDIDVFGPDPPCARCQTVKRNAERAVERLGKEGIPAKTRSMDIMAKETVKKYGVLISPAVAINGIVKFMGRVPSEDEIEKEIRSQIG